MIKTIVLFATSCGSGFGETQKRLKGSWSDTAHWRDEKLLNRMSDQEIKAWIDGLNLQERVKL